MTETTNGDTKNNGAAAAAAAAALVGTNRVKQGLAQMLKGGVIVSPCFVNDRRRNTRTILIR